MPIEFQIAKRTSDGGARGEPLLMNVSRLCMAVPQPVVTWGTAPDQHTLCLDGTALNTRVEGQRLFVPLREVYWNALSGYGERYLG